MPTTPGIARDDGSNERQRASAVWAEGTGPAEVDRPAGSGLGTATACALVATTAWTRINTVTVTVTGRHDLVTEQAWHRPGK